jgi:hypothetical protein
MTYIEELRNSKEKPQVAFQEFSLSVSKIPDYLFCFFEGKDNPYYVPRIKRYTNKYHVIKCGGRENVLDVYRLIKNRQEYNLYKKAFFIDRDFNKPIKPQNPPIYETPSYSIENLYVSTGVFREILINEFHLSEVSDDSFSLFSSLYSNKQKEFHSAIALFNAWYACLIEIRNTTGKKTGVTLGEKIIFKGKDSKDGGKKYLNFIDFTLKSITANYNMVKIKETFPNAIEVIDEKLNAKYKDFLQCEHYMEFRGKFEMQFLVRFIQLLLKDSFTSKNIFKAKSEFAFGDGNSLDIQQALNIFEGYAETPDSLVEYLKELTNK